MLGRAMGARPLRVLRRVVGGSVRWIPSRCDPMRLLFAFVLLGSTVCRAEAPPQALIDRLTEVIKQKCPDAAFETGERGFTAKQGTMTFTLHQVSKTGEV